MCGPYDLWLLRLVKAPLPANGLFLERRAASLHGLLITEFTVQLDPLPVLKASMS